MKKASTPHDPRPFSPYGVSGDAMQVQVTRVPRPNAAQEVTLDEGATVAMLLRRLEIPPDAVIVIRHDRPVPLDAPLGDRDALRIVNVFSGG